MNMITTHNVLTTGSLMGWLKRSGVWLLWIVLVCSLGVQARAEVWKEPITGMEFVWIEGGCFQMGCLEGDTQCADSEKPAHAVCLEGFWMGKTEVTQAQWQTIMGNNPSFFNGENRPVESILWNEGQEFLRQLEARTGTAFRLPTEAEWEYACRAGTQTVYSFGNDVRELGNYAWYRENSGMETHPVGQLKPNAWGFYDMHGNVWEWCADIYTSDAYRQHPHQNPVVTSGGSYRVRRGGSWKTYPAEMRSASRLAVNPTGRNPAFGLRLVRTK